MQCQVCLKNKRKLVDINSAISLHLNIAQILHKYLLFLPEKKEMSCDVCNDCWLAVSSFHQFYVSVEKAHIQLMQGNLCPEEKLSNNDQMCEQILLNEVKCEPSEAYLTKSEEQETPESALADPLIGEPRRSRRINSKAKKKVNRSATKSSSKATDELIDSILEDNSHVFMDDLSDEKCYDIESADCILSTPELNESSFSTTNNTEIKDEIWEPNHNTEENKPTDIENTLTESVSDAAENEEIDADKDEDGAGNESITEEFEDVDTFIAKNIKVLCEICEEEHPTIKALKIHMETVHQVKGYVRCCGKKLFSRYYLLEHIEKHNNRQDLKCKDCDRQFNSRHCLQKHMMRQHGKQVGKSYSCQQCNKSFSKNYLLVQHRSRYHTTPSISCSICEVSFPNRSSLKKHVDDKHKSSHYMCDMCGKLFKGITAFELHRKEHMGIALPKVQCTMCGAWLKNKGILRKHIKRHGDGNKYPCNICGKELSSQPALLRHHHDVHSTPKHICCVCKKGFRKFLHLKEHMTRHTGEKLYQCEFCSKMFSFNASFSVHRKTMHPKEYEAWVLKRRELAAQPVTIPQID